MKSYQTTFSINRLWIILSVGMVVMFGILLLLGIASSKFAARSGMPVLVLFLGVGMLSGSEGLGGLAFED